MHKGIIFLGVVILLVLAGAGGVYILTTENRQLKIELQELKEDPQRNAKEETAKIVALVGKLMILPEGEEPVLATVTDKEKLKDQPALAKAENGDKILIYSKAQKAYIYNQAKNIIVDVVPISVSDGQSFISGADENDPLRVALVNGSKNTGVTFELENRIKNKKILGLSVTSKATAKSSDYDKTLVIDLTGKLSSQATQLAQMVGGVVATQSAEDVPAADLMVIVGADFK